MTDDGPYIVVKNFERLIHYGKGRYPIWFKVYVADILRTEEFYELTNAERGILLGLWAIEAANRAQGRPGRPVSRSDLVRGLGGTVYVRHLQRLSHAGFILLFASKEQALQAQQGALQASQSVNDADAPLARDNDAKAA